MKESFDDEIIGRYNRKYLICGKVLKISETMVRKIKLRLKTKLSIRQALAHYLAYMGCEVPEIKMPLLHW